MKKILVIIAICVSIAMVACQHHFDELKVGSHISEMKRLVGSPDSIRDDFFNQLWFYPDYVITVSNDTVSVIRTKAQMQAEVQEMMDAYKKLDLKR
ncbi:MAG: hypothetical protein E7069_00355 [Bacteroidales bacterium]|nr:hypothetical protein [Bacteroidales bacterium]